MAQAVTLKLYGRVDFVHIYTPFTSKDFPEAQPKYRLNLIMDPRTSQGKESLAKFEAASKQISLEAWKKYPITWTDPKRFALRDGNTNTREVKNPKTGELEDQVRDGYENMKYLVATSANPPFIKDKDGKTDLHASDNRPYNGCYCNVVVNVKDTDKGGRGLFAYLEGVQFMLDHEVLGGGGSRVKAEEVFTDESGGDDDAA